MNGIGPLLQDLDDAYPLRRRRSGARAEVARLRSASRRAGEIRSLRRVHGAAAPPAPRTEEPGMASSLAALADAERACAALEARWESLERAVAAEEAVRGVEPVAVDPSALEEVERLTSDGEILRDAWRHRAAAPSPGLISGKTALAVGAGIALAALGAPHFAFHAALAARHATEGKAEIRRPSAGSSAAGALDRLRGAVPAGTPSADALREALDALSRGPRTASAWEGFLEAAQERIEVLRRAHLRARAAALVGG